MNVTCASSNPSSGSRRPDKTRVISVVSHVLWPGMQNHMHHVHALAKDLEVGYCIMCMYLCVCVCAQGVYLWRANSVCVFMWRAKVWVCMCVRVEQGANYAVIIDVVWTPATWLWTLRLTDHGTLSAYNDSEVTSSFWLVLSSFFLHYRLCSNYSCAIY